MLCGVNVAIVNGASVDLFPTHLRSMAVCISMLMGRFGTAIASYLIGLFIETHCILTYNLVSGLTLILFFVQFLIPDSK
jgi:MFS transporter, VNT family, synaptic vesicle glycoprotein 2